MVNQASSTKDNAEPAKTPTKYSIDELCENAVVVFKCKPEVVVGAIKAKFGEDVKQYSIAEIKTAIEVFLKRRVTNV